MENETIIFLSLFIPLAMLFASIQNSSEVREIDYEHSKEVFSMYNNMLIDYPDIFSKNEIKEMTIADIGEDMYKKLMEERDG